MKDFALLYQALDETTKTNEKVAAMRSYFEAAEAADAAWAVYFLTGRKQKQLVQMPKLVRFALTIADIPEWLFSESYDAVGDMAETIALLLPAAVASTNLSLHVWIEQRLLPLKGASDEEQFERVSLAWQELDDLQRFIWNKLLTGAFRVGVSQQLVIRALSQLNKVDAATIAHRLMGTWDPSPEFFQNLIAAETEDADISRPYPFYLAHPLDGDPTDLGEVSEWQAEWKWDGIRSQLIRRDGQTFIWSRGEELISERFPELLEAANSLPDGTVIDGEILPWSGAEVLPFSQLQQRIGRKTLTKKILAEIPVVVMVYDLLEFQGEDMRPQPLSVRRRRLEELLTNCNVRFKVSPIVQSKNWAELAESREQSRTHNVEGLMLKRLSSPYKVGRQRGDWWKWKVNPFTMDAVLIYAQRGSGKRASLYTDYTFGVWDNDSLVPVAKAYSGLTDEEIRKVDNFVRQNTIEKFGPVRTVKPELVFELAFEGIQKSPRHKSGIAVRFPRMLRWRMDKPAAEADTLEIVKQLLVDNAHIN